MQDQLRQGREDLKALQAKIAVTDLAIEEKDATMADLQRQAHATDGQVSYLACQMCTLARIFSMPTVHASVPCEKHMRLMSTQRIAEGKQIKVKVCLLGCSNACCW